MKSIFKSKHPSDASEQKAAEKEIRQELEKQLEVQLNSQLQIDQHIELDGFADGSSPICVEIWAHQGSSKGSQPSKVMGDCCKLLLVEKLLGKPCRKIFAVCDREALAFLRRSWRGLFMEKFGIEIKVVGISKEIRRRLKKAQKDMYR